MIVTEKQVQSFLDMISILVLGDVSSLSGSDEDDDEDEEEGKESPDEGKYKFDVNTSYDVVVFPFKVLSICVIFKNWLWEGLKESKIGINNFTRQGI